MTEKLKEKFENYLQEKDLELKDGILPTDLDTDIHSIKSDCVLLSKIYIKYFNEFTRVLRGCEDKELKRLIENKIIVANLISLTNFSNSKSSFGNSFYINRLNRYVLDNYEAIVSFVDFGLGVSGE